MPVPEAMLFIHALSHIICDLSDHDLRHIKYDLFNPTISADHFSQESIHTFRFPLFWTDLPK